MPRKKSHNIGLRLAETCSFVVLPRYIPRCSEASTKRRVGDVLLTGNCRSVQLIAVPGGAIGGTH